MTVQIQPAKYSIGSDVFDGAWIADDQQQGRQSTVLVFHGWEGRSQAQEKVAEQLVAMGYAAFACDVFGNGVRGDMAADNSQLIAPFLNDRALLRRRLVGTVEAVRAMPQADSDRIAAIGFCFGGLCVLDLARAGVDVRGVASFHGMFHKPQGVPDVQIKAKVIAFHGWDDPLAPPADVLALTKELTDAGADWQLHAFGHTLHAFMAVGANRPQAGIQYNERSARRAWNGLQTFLAEAMQ